MKHKCLPISLIAMIFALTGCNHDSSSIPASSEQGTSESEAVSSVQGGNESVSTAQGENESNKEYQITADENNIGGTLSFSKVKAKKGETIQINLVMEEGYYFNNIIIENVRITTVEEEKTYTFVMPSHDVVVKLNVAECGKLVSFYDTKTVGVSMNLELGLESKPGTHQDITLISTEVPFSSLFENYALLVGGQTYEIEPSNDEYTEGTSNYVVPEGEYAIYFIPLMDNQADDDGNTVTFDKPDNVNVYGLEDTTGLDVSGIYFYLDGGMDYNITDITYKLDGETEYKAFTEYTGSVLRFGSLVQVMFWEPESENMKDVSFHIEGKKDTLKDIIYDSNPELGGISSLPHQSFAGNKVFFSLQGITEATGYSMDDYTVTDDNGAEVATEREYADYIVCFDMPDSNAHFSFINNKMPTLSFTPVTGLTDVAFYNESDFRHTTRVNAVKAGNRFVAVPELADGYGIIKCEMDGQEIVKSSDDTFVATMPDHDVVLTFTLSSTHTLTINTADHGRGMYFGGKTTASAGETITAWFYPESGYVLDTVTCDGHPELDITINGKQVTFVMPDYDVALTPVFKATKSNITLTISLVGTTDILGDYTFTGTESGKTISKFSFSNFNSNKMYAGETVEATIKLIDVNKLVTLQINSTTFEGKEEELDPSDISANGEQFYTFTFDNIVLPDTDCTLSFVFQDRVAEA